jgi:hypothetical protein
MSNTWSRLNNKRLAEAAQNQNLKKYVIEESDQHFCFLDKSNVLSANVHLCSKSAMHVPRTNYYSRTGCVSCSCSRACLARRIITWTEFSNMERTTDGKIEKSC